MQCRLATAADVSALAAMNQQLIRDEGHRNPMTLEQLIERMKGFLAGPYKAVIFERDGSPMGYALYRRDPDSVYLRQFFVKAEYRRGGIGRKAFGWLRANVWSDCPRIRVDVLAGNTAGIAFWHAVGFADYCLTMELGQKNSK